MGILDEWSNIPCAQAGDLRAPKGSVVVVSLESTLHLLMTAFAAEGSSLPY